MKDRMFEVTIREYKGKTCKERAIASRAKVKTVFPDLEIWVIANGYRKCRLCGNFGGWNMFKEILAVAACG